VKENNDSIGAFERAYFIFLVSVFILIVLILFSILSNIAAREKVEKEIKELNDGLEKRVAERTEALFNSEKKYRYLFDKNPMPMWVVELGSYNFLSVNQAAITLLGYSLEEFMTMSVFDIVLQEDIERLSNLSKDKTPVSRITNRGYWNMQKKAGTNIIMEALSHDIIFEGKQSRLVLCNDVTERKKLEEQRSLFVAIVTSSEDAILSKDLKGIITSWNDGAERLYGYTKAEAIGKSILMLIPKDRIDEELMTLKK